MVLIKDPNLKSLDVHKEKLTDKGCDVTAYFMLGMIETHALLSVHGKIQMAL